jgi:transposase
VEAAGPAEPTVLQLLGRVAELEALVAQLQALVTEQAAVMARQATEIERLRAGGGTGKTPSNSSVPPSVAVPPNRSASGKKRGPKPGHVGRSRFRCQPDQRVELRPQRCRGCGADLSGVAGHVRGRSQQVELPPVKPRVLEVVRYRCRCPHCHTLNVAAPPADWDPHQRFGPRLQALIAYLHHQHHVGIARLRQLLADLFGLTLCEGALVATLSRVARHLEGPYAALREQVRGSPVVGSDETRQRVAGRSCWSWVVQSKQAAYHWVGDSRATKELVAFFGEENPVLPEVQECDLFSAQLASPVKQKAICQAHQLRDLQYAIERGDQQYAPKMARLIRLAIRLAKRRDMLEAGLFAHQRRRLQQLGHWLGFELRVENAFGVALQQRYQRLEEHWWTFLERDDVEPTNNASERAVRPVVIHRKVTGGFRSAWGAAGYARFISVTQTAQKQSQPLFPTLLGILAPHPLPIPE